MSCRLASVVCNSVKLAVARRSVFHCCTADVPRYPNLQDAQLQVASYRVSGSYECCTHRSGGDNSDFCLRQAVSISFGGPFLPEPYVDAGRCLSASSRTPHKLDRVR
jgi:hypothetical protein